MDELKRRALERIDALEPEFSEVCQWIFDHPEVGFEEYGSSQKLQTYLVDHGFHVEAGVAGMPTAFRAELCCGKGPKIGFICEYDALPEVGHACGHNIIGTSSATAAIAAAVVLEQLNGSIVVLGSPCEEGRGAGKQVLWEKGCMSDLDCALMFHPGPRTILSEPTFAVSIRTYTFHGKAARAWNAGEGRNALDAVVLMMNAASALRNRLPQGVKINGIITKGGNVPEMIPDLCQSQFSLRAPTRGNLEEAASQLEACAQATAQATGCTVEIGELGRTYDDIWPSRVIVDILEKNMKELEFPIDTVYTNTPFAATDMGNVSQHIPAIHSIYSLGRDAGQHTPEFAAACTGENAFRLTREISKALSMTAIDLLSHPEILEQAKEELRHRTGY